MELSKALNKMVDEYAAAIKAKLLMCQRGGYHGYDLPHMQGPIEQKLKGNFDRKDWVDVGALAAMRWRFTNESLKPIPEDSPK